MKKAPFYTHMMKRDEPQVEHVYEDVILNLSSRVEEILGVSGRMLSGSKTAYSKRYPDHEVFFNGCVFDAKTEEQIWFGDIDLTKDSDKLQKVADIVGDIYVTREHPYRWHGLKEGKKIDDDDLEEYRGYRRFKKQ